MAAPVIASSASSTNGGTGSHVITMPASIAVGNLVLTFLAIDNDPAMTWPAGWTQVGFVSGAAAVALHVYGRIADGTEGASITVTGGGVSDESACWAARITGAYQRRLPTSDEATAISTNPDPPSLNLVRCPPDVLWIAAAQSNDLVGFTAIPSGYTSQVTVTPPGAGGGVLRIASKETANAAVEDPGTFTLASSVRWNAMTIGVSPLALIQLPLTGVGP